MPYAFPTVEEGRTLLKSCSRIPTSCKDWFPEGFLSQTDGWLLPSVELQIDPAAFAFFAANLMLVSAKSISVVVNGQHLPRATTDIRADDCS